VLVILVRTREKWKLRGLNYLAGRETLGSQLLGWGTKIVSCLVMVMSEYGC
jgi:hypothetical protein